MTKLFTATLAVMGLMLTACAQTVGVTVPDGRYYGQYGFQTDYVVIKDGKVTDIHPEPIRGGKTDLTKFEILEYNPDNGAVRMKVPYLVEDNDFVCAEDTIPHDRLDEMNKGPRETRLPVYAECTRHGMLPVF